MAFLMRDAAHDFRNCGTAWAGTLLWKLKFLSRKTIGLGFNNFNESRMFSFPTAVCCCPNQPIQKLSFNQSHRCQVSSCCVVRCFSTRCKTISSSAWVSMDGVHWGHVFKEWMSMGRCVCVCFLFEFHLDMINVKFNQRILQWLMVWLLYYIQVFYKIECDVLHSDTDQTVNMEKPSQESKIGSWAPSRSTWCWMTRWEECNLGQISYSTTLLTRSVPGLLSNTPWFHPHVCQSIFTVSDVHCSWKITRCGSSRVLCNLVCSWTCTGWGMCVLRSASIFPKNPMEVEKMEMFGKWMWRKFWCTIFSQGVPKSFFPSAWLDYAGGKHGRTFKWTCLSLRWPPRWIQTMPKPSSVWSAMRRCVWKKKFLAVAKSLQTKRLVKIQMCWKKRPKKLRLGKQGKKQKRPTGFGI